MKDRVFLDQFGEPLFTLTAAPRPQPQAQPYFEFTPRPQLGFGRPGANRSWSPPTAEWANR